MLADRVIVLGANRGHIRAEVPIDVDRPRDRRSGGFEALVDKLYELLTGVEPGVTVPEPTEATPTARPLPHATVGGLAGLVEIVYARGGRAELAEIAYELSFEIDDLQSLVDAAALLDFVKIAGGVLELTSLGKEFTTADIQTSKQIFARQARERAPLCAPSARHWAPVPTATCVPASSSISSVADSALRTLSNNSTPPSAGAATANCSTTTPIPTRSPPTRPPGCSPPPAERVGRSSTRWARLRGAPQVRPRAGLRDRRVSVKASLKIAAVPSEGR